MPAEKAISKKPTLMAWEKIKGKWANGVPNNQFQKELGNNVSYSPPPSTFWLVRQFLQWQCAGESLPGIPIKVWQ